MTFNTSHVCRCGHYRVQHADVTPGEVSCRECDCDGFVPAQHAVAPVKRGSFKRLIRNMRRMSEAKR